MAKMIIKWITEDGREFLRREAAEEYEERRDSLEELEEFYLGKQLETVARNQGYFQHSLEKVIKLKAILLEMAHKKFPQEPWFTIVPSKIVPLSIVSRIFDDLFENHPIGKLWSRIDRIDIEGREWQQPFFCL